MMVIESRNENGNVRGCQSLSSQYLIAYCCQVFLKEADQIDSVTASHEAFFEFDDLGVSS